MMKYSKILATHLNFFAIFTTLEAHMNLIIAGIQGSGKGTHAKKLANTFDLVHISFGDALKECFTTDPNLVYPYTLERYNRGELAEDEVLFRVATKYLRNAEEKGGFILDGFPRTQGQMDFVLENWEIDRCIYLELGEEVAIERLKSRGRSDDTEEGIRRRLDQFHNVTEPIFKTLEADGRLSKVNTNQPKEYTFAEIMDLFTDD